MNNLMANSAEARISLQYIGILVTPNSEKSLYKMIKELGSYVGIICWN